MKFTKSIFACCLAMLMILSSCASSGDLTAELTDALTEHFSEQTTQPTTEPSEPGGDENNGGESSTVEYLTISEEEYYDKLLGGWLAEMVGVSWAASTEFDYCHSMMPENEMPTWAPALINNAYNQDDCYVEIPFLDAMNVNGAFCDISYMAENFKNSSFNLWHANKQGRDNLRAGIPYPYSGAYGICSDDIDWQIESDFVGMLYPGLVNEVAVRSFEIGHIMNYGDGVYGGVFVAAMHSAAFTASSIEEIVTTGLSVIPDGTKFKQIINEVLLYYHRGLSLEQNWQMIESKWGKDQVCGAGGRINIDAKLNASYIVMGLLYGEGDLAKTIIAATRCGQDSDCNPSNAASILGNFYGASQLAEQYTSGIKMTEQKFSKSEYSLSDVLEASQKLMNEIVTHYGAEKTDDGWKIPLNKNYTPVPFEQYGDCFIAHLAWADAGKNTVQMSLDSFGNQTISKVELNMGDGTVLDRAVSSYQYAKEGTYTVTFTVTGTKGDVFKDTRVVTVTKYSTVSGTPICSVTNPNGGGSKTLSVICDGVVPLNGNIDILQQYDTYVKGSIVDNAWIGLQFNQTYTISSVVFVEGQHFDDGGWFVDTPKLEILVNGVWVEADVTVSPQYSANNKNGTQCERYTFYLTEPKACTGIRISGKPGGTATFISASEIIAYAD